MLIDNILRSLSRQIKMYCRVSIMLLLTSIVARDFQYSKILDVPDLSFMPHVYTGLDILEQMDFRPLQGKRIAVFCNQTAVNRNGKHILDLLKGERNIEIYVILTPQYGLFGDEINKTKIPGKLDKDHNTGARIVNLLDRFVKPPEWTIRDVDFILCDLQDTGVRYSTFMTTLTKIMEVASELRIPVMVLDRPNPLRGDRLDGPVMRAAFQSFEGYHLVPIRHGLTIGEYALMVNEMGWVRNMARAKLTIVPMSNWKRNMWYDESDLPFVGLAPNIQSPESNLAFTGMNLLNGSNLNLGHGTRKPYFRAGAPWIAGNVFYRKLLELNLPGVRFKHIQYTPSFKERDGSVSLYFQQKCSGIELEITDRNLFDPIGTATSILILASQLYPRQFQWIHDDYINKLFGTNLLTTFAAQGKTPEYLPPQWMHDVIRFNKFRQKFLLYE